MTSTPAQPDRDEEPPEVFDPQVGLEVPTGLREQSPGSTGFGAPGDATEKAQAAGDDSGFVAPTPAAPVPNSHFDQAAAEAAAVPPEQYQRTEYGSADFDWEPTYSEAEDEEDQPVEVETPVRPEEAYMYETPEWERPQAEPPQLDSGRHVGWDAGFDDPAPPDTVARESGRRRRRSIPRAE